MVARGLLLTQAVQQIVGHHITWHNLEYVETRNLAHFIEFASDSGPFFGIDCQSVRGYPHRTERCMKIMISNHGTEICVAHGHSLWFAPEPFLGELTTFENAS